MQTFKTGAVRDIGGKGRMDLLPMCALIRLSKHFEKGSDDHGERNWEKGIPMHSFLDSAMRHIAKYIDGQTDEDHLCAAAWNILCAMWTEEKKPEMQDIPTRMRMEEAEKPIIECSYYDNMCNRCVAQKNTPKVYCHGSLDRRSNAHMKDKTIEETYDSFIDTY